MPSAWVERRPTKSGEPRFVVRYRIGGRESALRFAGSFRTQREAKLRRDAVGGDLAALRVPDVQILERRPAARTLRVVAGEWRASRVDVAQGTATTYEVNLGRILPGLGDRPVAELGVDDVTGLVAELVATGLARESIRKTLTTLAQTLDFAGVTPNPVRDRSVKLPPLDRTEIVPPTAAHVLAVLPVLPPRYRLPVLVLDATGMRVGELERLAWGDVDEQEGRWRVSAAVAKTGRARWVDVPEPVFRARSSVRATTGPRRGACSRASPGPECEPRSLAAARRPVSPRSRRTTCDTAEQLSGTWAGFPRLRRRRGSATRRRSICARTRTRCSTARSSTTASYFWRLLEQQGQAHSLHPHPQQPTIGSGFVMPHSVTDAADGR